MSRKQSVTVEGLSPAFPPYPHAVKAEGLVFVSGVRADQAGPPPQRFGDIPEAGRSKQQDFALIDELEGVVSAESWSTHDHLEKVLAAAGSSGDQILRQHIWQRDKRFFPAYENVRKHWQPTPAPSSGLGVKHVAGRLDHWIGIDAIAVCPGENPVFGERTVVSEVDNKDLPSASHYSQAVSSGPLVFTAGHIAIKTAEPGMPLVDSFNDVPEEGRFLATGRSHPDSRDGPIAAQTWFVYNELRRTLRSQGLDLEDTVNATIFLADLRDLATVHRVHRHFFNAAMPSLCLTGFDEVGHRGCRIEIELTALRRDAAIVRHSIDWPFATPYAAPGATQVGPLVFYSGMLGHDDSGRFVRAASGLPPEGRRIVEPIEEVEPRQGLAAQCWMALRNLEAVATTAGSSLADLAKMTVHLGDFDDLPAFETVRRHFIQDNDLPAFECVIIEGPAPSSAGHVQIEAIGLAG
ncbi:MAG: Rid family hydrolase [Alphaproteobacteria bacterium]|nr:Rid family hydrolase [Alphaproteobacteria bacterium]